MSLPPIFLTTHERYTQWTLHGHVHDRLSKQPGCTAVRYAPSKNRRRFVRTDVDTATFLGREHAVDGATLEVRFWNLHDDAYYRINWIEASRDLMVGFHRDDDHPELGTCHLQLDYGNRTIDRREASPLDAHPLAVLDTRLREIHDVLDNLEWHDKTPRFQGEER